MLKQRILTALVLLPLAILGFFWLDGVAFALFIGTVVSLGAWEWARLAGLEGQPARVGYAVSIAACLVVLALIPALGALVLLAGLLWWLAAVALVLTYPDSARYWGGRAGRLAIGALVLVPAWQALQWLKQWPDGNWLILGVMVLVWAADIGAYFFGRALGRRKLAPAVSPGKSWEGFFGGMGVSLALVVAVGLYRGWPAPELLMGVICAALVVAFSVVGDLAESMFKRRAGIKDSSQLLPGHGGVLDRIDSLTAAVPVFALLLWVAGWGV